MQIIFQDSVFLARPEDDRSGESIGEPLLVRGVLQGVALTRRVEELLGAGRLQPQHATRYPHEFSGGQRQRIVIARALALSPQADRVATSRSRRSTSRSARRSSTC
jgi:ABC-type oligopeptide transport system ATPase subunit